MNANTKYALLIGINYFGTPSELGGCHSDILDVNNYLSKIGYKPENIIIMLDKSEKALHNSPTASGLSFHLSSERIPTRGNIVSAMNECVQKCKKGDTLYVHYSGHGSNRTDTNGDEKDGIDECICPADYDTNGMLYDDEMRIVLVNALPEGVKLRVVFDSCHSGSALDLPFIYGIPAHTGDSISQENNKVLDKDVIFISGCKDPQTSADSQFDGHPNGALTYYLLKSLNKIQTATSITKKKECRYTFKDLIDIIRLGLKKNGYTQIPQLSMAEKTQLFRVIDIL